MLSFFYSNKILIYSRRFIRREKEIAETRFEVAQVESLRYRQRVELLERELQELQDSLNAEREKVQVCVHDLRKQLLNQVKKWS